MPPKVRVTKEMVSKASFEIIRRSGHESLSARAIAEHSRFCIISRLWKRSGKLPMR